MLKGLLSYGRLVANTLSGKDPFQLAPAVVFKFTSQQDINRWHTFTDSYFGGKSTADFRLSPSGNTAVFSGRCSTEQDEDADVKRAGYCCATSKVLAIGDYLNLEAYSHLVLNVRGDGNTYIANVRVDTMSGNGGDIWQVPFTPRAGVWSQVHIPFSSFAMTHQGQLVERRLAMDRGKITSLGVAISAVETHQDNGSSIVTVQEAQDDTPASTAAGLGYQDASEAAPGTAGAAAGAFEFQLELRDVQAEGTATDAGLQ